MPIAMNMSGANSFWILPAETLIKLWISLYVAQRCSGSAIVEVESQEWKRIKKFERLELRHERR